MIISPPWTLGAGPVAPARDTELSPLPMSSIRLTGGQLGRLPQANSTTSIPRGILYLQQEKAWQNFDAAAQGPRRAGPGR